MKLIPVINRLYVYLREYRKKKTQLQRLKLWKERQMQKIEAEYESKAKPLHQIIEDLERNIEIYCMEHRNEIFKDRKSFECAHGEVGFRESPPAVWVRNKKKAIEILQDKLPEAIRYIAEINKEVLKERYFNGDISDEDLRGYVLVKPGGEKFYIRVRDEVYTNLIEGENEVDGGRKKDNNGDSELDL